MNCFLVRRSLSHFASFVFFLSHNCLSHSFFLSPILLSHSFTHSPFSFFHSFFFLIISSILLSHPLPMFITHSIFLSFSINFFFQSLLYFFSFQFQQLQKEPGHFFLFFLIQAFQSISFFAFFPIFIRFQFFFSISELLPLLPPVKPSNSSELMDQKPRPLFIKVSLFSFFHFDFFLTKKLSQNKEVK